MGSAGIRRLNELAFTGFPMGPSRMKLKTNIVFRWNRNGSRLAVASPSGEEFDLWDTRTWSRKNRLSVGFLEADKKLNAYLSTTICQLCFDG